MARQESDREDLMREATALEQRAEFEIPGATDTVIVGCRADGALSFFFGPDPCYHFDRHGRLRRAFAEGRLYRSEGDGLSRLTRVRTNEHVELQRRDLDGDELTQFLDATRKKLRFLREALRDQRAECLQAVPDTTETESQLSAALDELLGRPLELSPPVRAR